MVAISPECPLGAAQRGREGLAATTGYCVDPLWEMGAAFARVCVPEDAWHERLEDVTLTVHLPEELARRVEALAAARGQSPEQVALEAIEAQVPGRRRLSFSGAGSSGQGDIARRHKQVIAEHFAGKTARDV